MSTVILSMQVSSTAASPYSDGEFDWPIVGDELLDLFNDQIANAETFLYGRRMYQEMAEFWPTGDSNPVATPAMADYARLWRPMPKIVFSDTLQQADWNTRIVGSDDLAATVAELRSQDRGRHILYGGAQLAGALMARDLIDEYWLFIHPVILGDGPRLFADLEHRLTLEQVETRTFPGSVVHVRYRCAH